IAASPVTSKPWMRRDSRSWRAVSLPSTSFASPITVSSLRSKSAFGIGPRSANSAGRSRLSAAPPSPATIHCRTLSHRCRIRLPMLLSEGRERHHTCSSVNWPRQCLILPRALANSFAPSAPTAAATSSAVIIKRLLFDRDSLEVANVPSDAAVQAIPHRLPKARGPRVVLLDQAGDPLRPLAGEPLPDR